MVETRSAGAGEPDVWYAGQGAGTTAKASSNKLAWLVELAAGEYSLNEQEDCGSRVETILCTAFPGLTCRLLISQKPIAASEDSGAVFPLCSHGREYGVLQVAPRIRRRLTGDERHACAAAAHLIAKELCASEQSAAAAEAGVIKEQFLATVSHELRTPLHAILGYLEVLNVLFDPAEIASDVRDSIDRLYVNAVRLNDLIQQVLLFAEVRAGRRVVHAVSFAVPDFVANLVPTVSEFFGDKPVQFSWSVREGLDVIHTDQLKLRQILVCLLNNAGKFTEAGEVSLTVESDGDGHAEFNVCDTGIGIAPADQERIFEYFHQLDGSVTRRHGGIGLGLALARNLADLLGGEITLQSELGKGTSVRLRVPLEFAQAASG